MEGKPLILFEYFLSNKHHINCDKDIYLAIENCFIHKACDNFISFISKTNKEIEYLSMYIGLMYETGEYGFDQDRKKAVYWYEKAFNTFGIIESGEALAVIYKQNKEYKKSYDICQILAVTNSHMILTALGNFYNKGIYVKKDLEQALQYYNKATLHGNLSAPMRIAGIYRQQGKYLASLMLMLSTLIKRIKETWNNKNAEERFREF
ncbi:MAG: sel1 repeat family protein [Gammaproteobacteria bacterium]|nr:sel1 repeat family protein [Gammaproteobacteria bacterium]